MQSHPYNPQEMRDARETSMPRARNGAVEIEYQTFGDDRPETILLVNGLAVGSVAGGWHGWSGLGPTVPPTCARAACNDSVGHVPGGDAAIGTSSPRGRGVQDGGRVELPADDEFRLV